MARHWPAMMSSLAWFHRWAGVVLCVLFAMWFASGAVLHFVGFPSLPAAERLARGEPIDFSHLKIDASTALTRAPRADELRLVSAEGRPRYLASSTDSVIAIAGDTGEVLPLASAHSARNIAERFSGQRAASVNGPFDYDQWTVHQQFDRFRPLFRVRLAGRERTDLYVSATSGEVVQRTRGNERAWNWLGAVMHWIYFTPVRKNWSVWDQTVWWVSLAATLTTIAGTWLGIVRMLATRATGRSRWSPFRGWLRWHHLIGLFASVIVLAYIFSGWLSMDHGRLFSRAGATAEQNAAMRGMSLDAIARLTTPDRLRSADPVAEIELSSVASRPFLILRGSGAAMGTTVAWLDSGEISDGPLPRNLILAGLRAAWGEVTVISETSGTETLYRLAESVSSDALAAKVGGAHPTRVYVDEHSGRLLATMDSSRSAYAWLYYGLHTFKFPGLNASSATRTTLVVLLVALGLAFSVTGIVIGVRRARLQFGRQDSTATRVRER